MAIDDFVHHLEFLTTLQFSLIKAGFLMAKGSLSGTPLKALSDVKYQHTFEFVSEACWKA